MKINDDTYAGYQVGRKVAEREAKLKLARSIGTLLAGLIIAGASMGVMAAAFVLVFRAIVG